MKFLLTLLPFWFSLTLAEELVHPEVASALQHVTANLYLEVIKTDSTPNFVFSPFSLTDIMALVQSGAYGATGEEIRTAFSLRSKQTEVDQAFSHIKKHILEQKEYSVRSANKIYVANDVKLRDSFKQRAEGVYYSGVENIDFGLNVVAAQTINQWVEEKTNNKIKNLINPLDLSGLTKALLVNALHLKADWVTTFEFTKIAPFNLRHFGKNDRVETMYGIIPARYYHNQELNARFLEIPLKGGEVTFTVALPVDVDGIDSLEKDLEEVLKPQNYPTNLTSVKVELPKFKIETELDLNEILQKMGVTTVFTGAADLSGIAGLPGDLQVDKVEQKAFVNVNENGVEAAAATFVGMVDYSAPIYDHVFRADHPFIFYIKFKDFVIFAGRVADPQYD